MYMPLPGYKNDTIHLTADSNFESKNQINNRQLSEQLQNQLYEVC